MCLVSQLTPAIETMWSVTCLLADILYTSLIDNNLTDENNINTSRQNIKNSHWVVDELQLPYQLLTTLSSKSDIYDFHQKYVANNVCTAWMIMETMYIFSFLLSIGQLWKKNSYRGFCYTKAEENENEQYHLNIGKYDSQKLKSADEKSEFPDLTLNGRWWKPPETHLMVYTVPKYPDNHNPLLPLNLQQQLDEMSPREYLTYVLKELTLEERESLMVDEKQRRRSFQVNWPYDDQRSGIRMAQAGFYSLDSYDRVQCVFCRGSLHNWDTGETPLTEHGRSFNFCRFIKGLECGNREYRSNMLSEDDVRNITQFKNTATDRHRRNNVESIDSAFLGISVNRAAMIRYAPDATRLRTFARWPASCPITAQRMCDAGFYFTGFDDQVRCFYCSGGIKQWSEKDDPWEEHARWFPDCAYLIQQKGQSYVDEVHAKTPANKRCVRKTQAQQKTEIKQIQYRNEQGDMRSVCLRLGHSPDAISRTLERHGKPFDSIGDMIEALYDTELHGEGSSDDATEDSSSHINTISTQSLACPEADRHRILDQAAESITPGRFDGTELRPRHRLGCRKCEKSTEGFVPATHVGLPCGHLIFCDSCNGEEKRKSTNPNYSIKCPFYKCGAPLSGTIKIYLC